MIFCVFDELDGYNPVPKDLRVSGVNWTLLMRLKGDLAVISFVLKFICGDKLVLNVID